MFGKIAWFEFRYQLRNPVFWVTGGGVFPDDVRRHHGGATFASAPPATCTRTPRSRSMQVSGILVLRCSSVFMLVAFVANVVVRDDDTGFGPIIRATRVRKFDYLIGRFHRRVWRRWRWP